jgi:hypothetical protein
MKLLNKVKKLKRDIEEPKKEIKKISEVQPTVDDLAEEFNLELDEHLYSLNKIPRDRSIDEFHPSEISKDFCPRMWCLMQKNSKLLVSNIEPELRLKFDTGSEVHTQFQKYYANMKNLWGYYNCRGCKDLCKSVAIGTKPDGCRFNRKAPIFANYKYNEIKIKDARYKIAGHVDGILYPTLRNKKMLLEIKTCNDQVFTFLKAPMKEHVVQASIYLWCLERMRDDYNRQRESKKLNPEEREFHKIPFDGTVFLYYNKNWSTRKTFIIPYEEEKLMLQMNPILEKIQICLDAIEENVLPDGLCGKKKSKKCCFSGIC